MSDIEKEIQENLNKQKDEKVEVKESNILQKAATFAQSVASKGFTNRKAEPLTLHLRQLSCHGDESKKLPPCSERNNSVKFPGSFFCGACGCGDKEMTQLATRKLDNGENAYYKLEFPKVHCPLMMPGFTNYVHTTPGLTENNRKKFIEFTHGIEYIREHSK